MKSNAELVKYLVDFGFLKTKRVIEAFKAVDRAHFVLPSQKESAYADYPLPLFRLQTISAPSVVAIMTEALELPAGGKVLEVGTGSGYQAAVLAGAVGPKGKIVTVERVQELFDYARQKVSGLPGLKNVFSVCGDGSVGYAAEAPFDAIVVTCGAPSVPKPLFEQLKEGGKMVIPIGGTYFQDLILVEKRRGRQASRSLLPVMFVPMHGKNGFKE
ncbi:MAG: protein-L-isoaspartate(D-aspartate) O-methyltransferase [Candidatus Micrarchaeota archaeon]|nr:protein-L-isoaspartate(D-aspartate) O-methyltransferase [Candidatus Micrarchaeota archaeon]